MAEGKPSTLAEMLFYNYMRILETSVSLRNKSIDMELAARDVMEAMKCLQTENSFHRLKKKQVTVYHPDYALRGNGTWDVYWLSRTPSEGTIPESYTYLSEVEDAIKLLLGESEDYYVIANTEGRTSEFLLGITRDNREAKAKFFNEKYNPEHAK